MTERFEYEIANNCFVVLDTKKSDDNKKIISNFTAKIVKEEKRFLDNGNMETYYCIEGKIQSGEVLEPIKLSSEEFDQGKWFRKHWGVKVDLHDFDGSQNKVLKHLLRAIYKLSGKSIPSETVYQQSGIEIPKSGEPMYLFGNGAVTSNGIVTNHFCNLPAQLSFYRLPEQISDDEKNNEAIRAVFDLLNLSDKNPYIGLLSSLTGSRAIISMWLPIEEFIFMVGPKATFKSSIAKILQSFFGPFDSKNCLVGWDSTPTALQDLAIKARNGVLCVDDFVYPATTNRRSDFTNKAHEFLRAVANRSPKSRANITKAVVSSAI